MEAIASACKNKEMPHHHLWGANLFHKFGITTEIISYYKYPALKRQIRHRGLCGDLNQQLQLLHRSDYDAVYSGAEDVTNILAYLRALKIFRKPIISVVHHPLHMVSSKRRKYGVVNLFRRLYVAGTDRMICLNQVSSEYLKNVLNVKKSKRPVVQWGPDTSFYRNFSNFVGDTVVSVGFTFRDYTTFAKAMNGLPIQSVVFCAGQNIPMTKVPKNVNIVKQKVKYDILMDWYKRARVVAIPLQRKSTLVGLTILLDAMAVGKPVIMTKNNCIDIDIEREGFGFWVDPYDIAGWKKRLRFFIENPEHVSEMGKRARSFCQKCNIDAFAVKTASIIQETVEGKSVCST